VEQLHTGCYWAEGPVWFGDGRSLLFSDIPNNRILRWDDTSGAVSAFRAPSNHANGLARDTGGRLLACEHGTRRVTRTEYDGRITVLADQLPGKRLNSPNDIVCQMNGPRTAPCGSPTRLSASRAGGKANPPRPNCRTASTASTR
jgi:gluconolactonase